MIEDIQFLKELQDELRTQDHDCQAAPRFWVVMDYHIVPANEEYDSGFEQYFYNNGDHIRFNNFTDLKEFIEENFEEKIALNVELQRLLSDEFGCFYELWEYVESSLNDDGFFSKVFVKEEEHIAPNTMFLTKEEAERHLKNNRHHYSAKAHTFAMTAWRSPKVERLLNILETFEWEKFESNSN